MTAVDWESIWPEAIDPETGEDPDGVIHPEWVDLDDEDLDEDLDWTADPQ